MIRVNVLDRLIHDVYHDTLYELVCYNVSAPELEEYSDWNELYDKKFYELIGYELLHTKGQLYIIFNKESDITAFLLRWG
ncbi:MAG: hypothetical protein HOK52_07355 [Candidatus Marinimicrobia bacterium]|jgi:hypothetical protein|nr:hypothetical protein [Candidatus Woesearchaeota archaeon]MBT6471059.1 hypothetical protein [Candidatus Neomarinimicrobiota bacterium]